MTLADSEMYGRLSADEQAIFVAVEAARLVGVIDEELERSARIAERRLSTDPVVKRRLRREVVEAARLTTSAEQRAAAAALCSSLALTEDEQNSHALAGDRPFSAGGGVPGDGARQRKLFCRSSGIGLPRARRGKALGCEGYVASFHDVDEHGRAARLRTPPPGGVHDSSWWHDERVYSEPFDRMVASKERTANVKALISQREMDAYWALVGSDRAQVMDSRTLSVNCCGDGEAACLFPRRLVYGECRFLVSKGDTWDKNIEASVPKPNSELRELWKHVPCGMCRMCSARLRARWKHRAAAEVACADYCFMATFSVPPEHYEKLLAFVRADALDEVDGETGKAMSVDFDLLPESTRCSRMQRAYYHVMTRTHRLCADEMVGGRARRQAALTAPLRWLASSEMGEANGRFHSHSFFTVGASVVDEFRYAGLHDKGRLERALEEMLRRNYAAAVGIPAKLVIVDIQLPRDMGNPMSMVGYILPYMTKFFGMFDRPRVKASHRYGERVTKAGEPGFLQRRVAAFSEQWRSYVAAHQALQRAHWRAAVDGPWRQRNGLGPSADVQVEPEEGSYRRSDRPPDGG